MSGLYALFPNDTITWKDLVFMSMAFSIIVSMLGFPPIVSATVSVIIFSLFHVNVDVADKENREERKAAFIASLLFGVVAGYIMAFKFSIFSTFMGLPSKIIVVLLCAISLLHYGEKLRFWSLDNDYSAFIVDNWLRWRDIIFITMAFSFPLGAIDNGIGPLVAVISSSIFYGFMKIYNQDMNKQFSFILSVIIGVAAGAMFSFKNYKGVINFGNPLFALSVVSLLNYISTVYNIPISSGIITLLFSIAPVLVIGSKNAGLSMLVSTIVSMGLMLFRPYDKSKPWLLRQSIYVGLLVGTSVSIAMESFYKNTIIEHLNVFMGYTWISYFVIYILSLFSGDKILPTGWYALFDPEKMKLQRTIIKRDQLKQKQYNTSKNMCDSGLQYNCEIKYIEY
jgi:hypothetical protein